MEPEEILARFALLAGLTAEEAQAWRALCGDAAAEISAQLREGADARDARLTAACAALAFYRYALTGAAGGGESFSAGDVKVARAADTEERAERLWLQARRAAAPLLRDGDFLFRRVVS